jgi:sugar phosphate isomerase/epimerase
MELGFVTAILPDLRLNEVLDFASQTGYDCVEVMCWPVGKAERRYAGVTHLDVSDFNEEKAEDIVELTVHSKVQISALGYYPNPLSPDKQEARIAIEHLKTVIDASRLLGINLVTTFVGKDWTKSVEENWPGFLEVWKPLIEYAEGARVKIGIENCPMLFTSDEWPGGKNLKTTPEIWERMYEDIQSDYFGLNFDPSHFIWQHMDYLSAVKEFGHKFFHVHAKDARLDRAHLDRKGILAHPNEYHTPKLPGLGEVDWRAFFSVLSDQNYSGPVCVEVEDRAFEGSLEKRKEALRQSYVFLRQFVP